MLWQDQKGWLRRPEAGVLWGRFLVDAPPKKSTRGWCIVTLCYSLGLCCHFTWPFLLPNCSRYSRSADPTIKDFSCNLLSYQWVPHHLLQQCSLVIFILVCLITFSFIASLLVVSLLYPFHLSHVPAAPFTSFTPLEVTLGQFRLLTPATDKQKKMDYIIFFCFVKTQL